MDKKNNTISIVYATDYNYLRYTIVSMYSLLTNLDEAYFCDIVLLVPKDMPEDSELCIRQSLNNFNNFSCRIIRMGNEFDQASLTIEHITIPTYYRLLLPNILPDINKCIYIDGDTIVSGDISSLYNTDLMGCYVAGVKSIGYSKKEKETRIRLAYEENMPFIYINAGVLLLDLEALRKHNMAEKMLNLLPLNLEVQDQDIINYSCKGRILALPMYYNTMPKYISGTFFSVSGVVSKKEFDRCKNNPVIIHYADKVKPWNNPRIAQAEIWYHYCLKPECWRLFWKDTTPLLEEVLKSIEDKNGLCKQFIRMLNKVRKRINIFTLFKMI